MADTTSNTSNTSTSSNTSSNTSSSTSTDNNTSSSSTPKTSLVSIIYDTYEYIKKMISNPLIIILVVIFFIYLIFTFLGNSMYPHSNSMLITIIVSLVIIFVVIKVLHKFYNINIISKIKHMVTGIPAELDIIIDANKEGSDKSNAPVPEIMKKKQVFNIPGNEYGYSDASALCKAYGARLATYNELESAYNNGADWCNYGWSDNQMALFPTQESTYNELQKIEGHENDCGRPGINGGYMANPHVKFGVNCYGYKPKITKAEEELMASEPLYPKTKKDIAMENRVNYWKDKLSEIMVSPFNHNTWSKI